MPSFANFPKLYVIVQFYTRDPCQRPAVKVTSAYESIGSSGQSLTQFSPPSPLSPPPPPVGMLVHHMVTPSIKFAITYLNNWVETAV